MVKSQKKTEIKSDCSINKTVNCYVGIHAVYKEYLLFLLIKYFFLIYEILIKI